MESWIVSLVIALVGVVGTYAVLRNRVTRLEADYQQHMTESNAVVIKIHERIDASFKRADQTLERVVILERDTSTHLTMPKAEEKFVSKVELALQLKNISQEIHHTNRTVDDTNSLVKILVGKLDDMNQVLHTNIVSTLIPKELQGDK